MPVPSRQVATADPERLLPALSFRTFAPVGPETEPAGLYVHLPFCSAICPYCDFAVTRGDTGDRAAFLGSLLEEVAGWSAPGVSFDTVYLGGGTPSAMSGDQLAALLEVLERRFTLSGGRRITLEANPEDVDAPRAAEWRRLGVDTLSLGVQALGDAELRFLGRRHRRGQALRAVEQSLAAGFRVVSLDLIYGLPGQRADDWRRTLSEAATLGARHLSCYELTIHPGTPFARLHGSPRFPLPQEEERRELFLLTHRELAAAGWQGYEVSNFAADDGARSRHNEKYWRHVPYLGLGPSAHSFDGRRRWWNRRTVDDYRRALAAGESAVAESETLDRQSLALECLMLGLRTTDGVDLAVYERRFGVDLVVRRARELEALEAQGLVTSSGGRLRPTLPGMAVADALVRMLS